MENLIEELVPQSGKEFRQRVAHLAGSLLVGKLTAGKISKKDREGVKKATSESVKEAIDFFDAGACIIRTEGGERIISVPGNHQIH